MQQVIRLYYPEDIDLISLRLKLGNRFNEAARKSVLSVATGEDYVIPIYDSIVTFARKADKPVMVKVTINEKKNREVYEYIMALPPHSRSRTIKNVMRGCYDRFPIGLFSWGKTEKVFFEKEIPHIKEELHKKPIISEKKETAKNTPAKKAEEKGVKQVSDEKKTEKNSLKNQVPVQDEKKNRLQEEAVPHTGIKADAAPKQQEDDNFDTLYNMAF